MYDEITTKLDALTNSLNSKSMQYLAYNDAGKDYHTLAAECNQKVCQLDAKRKQIGKNIDTVLNKLTSQVKLNWTPNPANVMWY